VLNRFSFSTKIEDLDKSNIVIEAIVENFDVKKTVFQQLEQVTSSDTILASNTSSISITKIAGAIPDRADKVIGMHFMNPVPVMKLVEVIKGLQTSQDTLDTVLNLAKDMNKITSTARDVPGFIANRILIPYINEAVFALYEGIGTAEDIDKTMKYGTNVPMGPLTLADFIGLDTVLAI
jgi:3-hydroxybutyryl-CoA dehydrogenase